MTQVIVFWLGGVLCRTSSEAVIRWAAGSTGEPPTAEKRVRLRDLQEGLRLGRLASRAFLDAAAVTVGLPTQAEELGQHFLAGESVEAELAGLLGDLSERYPLWLLSDYPRDWLLRLDAALGLRRWFPGTAWILCPELGLPAAAPDLFLALPELIDCPREQALLIEPDPRRAAAAVREGLNAIVFNGTWRLQRELRLRELLPWPPG